MLIRQCANNNNRSLRFPGGQIKTRLFSVICATLLFFAFPSPIFSLGTETILYITLNQVQKGEFLVNVKDYGDFLLKTDDLKTIGFKDPGGVITEIAGEPYISLKSMKGLDFIFNEKELSLVITASPSLLPATVIDFMPERRPKVYYPRDNSVFLNYAINYFETIPSESYTYSLSNEMGIRLRDLLFLSDFSYTRDRSKERSVRLMSSLTYDRWGEMQRTVLGDFFASSGDLGSSLNLGGISFSKIYQIDPYFIKNPLLDFSGLVSFPSEVETYLDGVRIRTEKLPPGEFQVRNLHSYGGAADAEVVIRDPFGREERITTPFYFTDILLSKRLHEYSYNIGLIREDFGIESDQYGEAAYSFFHKYGVSNSLTLGVMGEGTEGLHSIGSQGAYLVTGAGVLTLAVSGSSEKDAGDGFSGLLTYGYQGRKINTRFFLNGYSEDYRTINSRSLVDRPKYTAGAGLGYFMGESGSISLDFTSDQRYGGEEVKVATATYSRNLTRSVRGFITLRNVTGEASSNEFFIGLNFFPWKNISVSARYRHTEDLKTSTLQVQKNPPVGEGFGYQATVESIESLSSDTLVVNPSLQYNAAFGSYRGEYRAFYADDDNTGESYHLSASGGIVYVGNAVGFTRPVTDSFGLVKVGDLEGIRVYQSNQEIGRTDGSGKVFVPNMGSYYENQISISDKDVPIDYSLSDVTQYVSPPLRSGSCIVFGAEKLQFFIGMLKVKTESGIEPVEFYEVAMQINGKEITFPTGKGGELYFENIISSEQPEFKDCSYMDKGDSSFVIKPGKYKATFDYRGKTCSLDIVIPESDEMIVDLGDIECDIISSSPLQLSE